MEDDNQDNPKKRMRQLITFYEIVSSPVNTPTPTPNKRRKVTATHARTTDALQKIEEDFQEDSKKLQFDDIVIKLAPLPKPLAEVEEVAQEIFLKQEPALTIIPLQEQDDIPPPPPSPPLDDDEEPEPIAEPKHNDEQTLPTLASASQRSYPAKEIVSTEKSYVESLRTCVSNYMLPLRRVLDENESASIFANLPNILRFNETLLTQLRDRMANFQDSTALGDIFVNLAPFLSMYSDYCSNFETGSALVQKMRQSNSAFVALIDKAVISSGGLKLEDFLIMPVQRVPRYRMLLESLLKHTAADHPDFEALTTALKIVSDKANEINQKMALASQQRKTMELSSRFGALPLEETLVQPYRHFVTEFIFNSYNNVNEHSTKRLSMFMFNDLYILTNEDIDKEAKLECIGLHYMWSTYLKKLQDSWALSKEENIFQLVTPQGTYTLAPLSLDEKNRFKTEFEAAREKFTAHQPIFKTKRAGIKVHANEGKQEWMAVEPAPTFAARTSQENLAMETAEFTKMALEELLRENEKLFESRMVTPVKTPKKSRIMNFKEGIAAKLFSPLVGKKDKNSKLSPRRQTLDPRALTPPKSAAKDSPIRRSMVVTEEKENDESVSNQAELIRSQIAELSKKKADLVKSGSPSFKTPLRTPSRKRSKTLCEVAPTDEPTTPKSTTKKKRKPTAVTDDILKTPLSVKHEKKRTKVSD